MMTSLKTFLVALPAFVFSCLLLGLPHGLEAVEAPTVFPGATWAVRSPAEVGMDEAKLNAYVANVGGRGVIVKNGYIVKSWGAQTTKADWASAAKPVVSTLLMFTVHEGKLASVDALIRDWGWNLISKDRPMTFRHLANMLSGYARGEAPGARWAYNDYAISLYIKTLFDRVFNEGAPNQAALHPNRLGALQFQDGSIFSSRDGYGFFTTPRDAARIGWFWLHKGRWQQTQLLPTSFFDLYMQPQVPSGTLRTSTAGTDYLGVGTSGGGSNQTQRGPGVYGFNWWHNAGQSIWPDAPSDTVQANGHWNKEVITVIPSLHLVEARLNGNGSGNPTTFPQQMNAFLQKLVSAVIVTPPQVVFTDNFNRGDSASVGGGWIEVEGSGAQVELRSNGLYFADTSDVVNRPMVSHGFSAPGGGQVMWRFDFNWARTGSEGIYRLFMQLGDGALMTTGSQTAGVGVNLVWTSVGGDA